MNPMLYLLLVLSLILCCVAAAQNTALTQTNPPAAVSTPTPPPLPPTPVDTFRRVLGMSAPEREKFLGTLSPEKRQVVLLKLDEYQGMPAEEREKRLRALQVRFWVRQLIRLPQSNRVERLVALQPAVRQLVEARLAEWDRLPADLQREVVTNELVIRHIAQLPDFRFNPALPPLPPDPRMAAKLKHWNQKSEAERAEILAHFESFFTEFSPAERAKIMARRPEMATNVTSIANLTEVQRERYLAGFKRFSKLTPAEQQRFLINAERWQKMSPEQQESWRILAKKLNSSSPPPPPPPRPSASVLPTTDHAAADLPSR
jgi:uncharacterized protein DUF3106